MRESYPQRSLTTNSRGRVRGHGPQLGKSGHTQKIFTPRQDSNADIVIVAARKCHDCTACPCSSVGNLMVLPLRHAGQMASGCRPVETAI